LQRNALAEIANAHNVIELDQVRVKYLGRSGLISKLSESMRSLSKEDRPRIGKLLNEVRSTLDHSFAEKSEAFAAQQDLAALDDLDETLPATPVRAGALHPLTQLQDQAIRIFRRLGFTMADGPDIETEWHCFDAAFAYPYLDRPNPYDGCGCASDQGDRSGRRLSTR
jgi:phenylalanyl-tRNA synthetase alpha chain